ncbi:MAG: GGDEF domain-containing protein [Sedimentisphaerales bacterium]|nr:GGDEF domain-containing protein [Sedimentisphaerales bacterium]
MKTDKQNNYDFPGQAEAPDYLRGVLEELALLHETDDLLERYQSFIRVVEKSLFYVLGPCNVTLWSPDSDNNNLIECVIMPQNQTKKRTKSLSRSVPPRKPCVLPLDSVVVRESLDSGRAYWIGSNNSEVFLAGRSPQDGLRTDVCIPLYRDYGKPLLVNAERAGGSETLCKKENFKSAVQLIEFFWKQLQATNQRQWLAEHDENTQALRAETFLEKSQSWADDLFRQDELFSLTVITVRGFRRTFAGNSQNWRSLCRQLGRCLRQCIARRQDSFLLGKMSDDVFAVLLPGKDKFLAETLMKAALEDVGREMTANLFMAEKDYVALESFWTTTDSRQYCGAIEKLLNDIYRRLFIGQEDSVDRVYKIMFGEQAGERISASCR